MDISILADYVDRIFKFALSKSISEYEAEELSQEILLTAMTSLPKLRDESRFEPWLWSLAANTARSHHPKTIWCAMCLYNGNNTKEQYHVVLLNFV